MFAEALQAILEHGPALRDGRDRQNGGQAVELAETLEPDVVLMDISMPVLDGFEATRKLRKRVPETCVLMLTGSNARHDVDRARRAGAAGYVTKDRIAGELIEAILQVVEPEPENSR